MIQHFTSGAVWILITCKLDYGMVPVRQLAGIKRIHKLVVDHKLYSEFKESDYWKAIKDRVASTSIELT